MDNLLNELDVVKLARALPDGFARDQAIVKAIELLSWAERAVAEAGDGESEEPGIEVMRGGSGGAGSGGGKGGRK
jgi:hypothetical protein